MNFAIIAAGKGERLMNEGILTPKPLVKIGDEPMMGRLLRIFSRCGANTVSIIINQQATQVSQWIEAVREHYAFKIQLVERTTACSLESLAEISKVIPAGEACCFTTTDTVFDSAEFETFITHCQQSDAAAVMAVTPEWHDEKPLLLSCDARGRVKEFTDVPTGEHLMASAGIYYLAPEAIALIKPCFEGGFTRLRDFQRSLLQKGLKVTAFTLNNAIDVDDSTDVALAHEFITKVSKHK